MPARFGLARKTLAILAGSTLLLAACAAPNKLLVLEWSGYDDPDYWTDFKSANPEAAVTFEIGSSDADVLGKMEAGSQADVFHFYTGWQQFYVDAGLVKEIDTSKLTNWDKVPDSFKEMGQIDGKQYYLPWDWGFTSILYNTDEVASVDSWDVLFDETYAGHISMWDDGPAAVTVSSYVHGWDETAITDEQLAQAEQEWKDQKDLNFHYWTDEYADLCPDVESGDIWIAYAWQGCYADRLYAGQAVAYANPVEGRNSWVGLYGISSKTANYDLALEFLDMKLATLTCTNAVVNFYYGCANQEVMEAIDDPVLIQAFSIDDPSILESTNFTPLVTDAQREAWTEMWANVKAD
ncbi:MAG TPA: extracellular solute-binding protein [Candidatus Limnocylindria bacterium]|nr:extracellular solute-binding protein [Candidatus Limnocylindria bacterium]